jgi:5-formyltetrahydrofolate cyclo-ligase
MELTDKKKQLRHNMRELLSSKSAHTRVTESKLANELLIERVIVPLRCNLDRPLTVFSYLSFGHELDTSYLIQHCLQAEDTVVVPRVASKTALQLRELHPNQKLVVNKMGISEPESSSPILSPARYHEIDLVIVPGLAYDASGGRIGYGGGYYDRFITHLRIDVEGAGIDTKQPLLVSLLFKEQLINEVPIAPHDFKVNMLITSEKVYKC